MAEEFVCVCKCYHRGKIYQKGDEYLSVKDEKMPIYFAKKGTPVPEDPTPRLGTKVAARVKPLPSMKAPGKKDVAAKE